VTFALPPINTPLDVADAMSAVLSAVATGRLTPADAAEISKVFACIVKAFEATKLTDRLVRIDKLSDEELDRIGSGQTITVGRLGQRSKWRRQLRSRLERDLGRAGHSQILQDSQILGGSFGGQFGDRDMREVFAAQARSVRSPARCPIWLRATST
jgi:hypothetical protein